MGVFARVARCALTIAGGVVGVDGGDGVTSGFLLRGVLGVEGSTSVDSAASGFLVVFFEAAFLVLFFVGPGEVSELCVTRLALRILKAAFG